MEGNVKASEQPEGQQHRHLSKYGSLTHRHDFFKAWQYPPVHSKKGKKEHDHGLFLSRCHQSVVFSNMAVRSSVKTICIKLSSNSHPLALRSIWELNADILVLN